MLVTPRQVEPGLRKNSNLSDNSRGGFYPRLKRSDLRTTGQAGIDEMNQCIDYLLLAMFGEEVPATHWDHRSEEGDYIGVDGRILALEGTAIHAFLDQ